MQAYVPAMVPLSGEVTIVEGISSILLNYFPSSWKDVLTLHLNLFYRSGYR